MAANPHDETVSSSFSSSAPSDDDEQPFSCSCSLPPEIYWNHVRPFQPRRDRAVVTRRCTTRFHAGDRPRLDAAYLDRHHARADGGFGRLPRIVAPGGGSGDGFRIDFPSGEEDGDDEEDPEAALLRLRSVRSAWDGALRDLNTPARRLRACLELACREGATGREQSPLLFPGDGTVSDIVEFHADTDEASVLGAVSSGLERTQLGYWVGELVGSIMGDLDPDSGADESRISPRTQALRDAVIALFRAGADVGPFFEPRETMETEEVFHCPTDLHEPGMSVYELFHEYADWLADERGVVVGLDWLIGSLGRVRSRTHPLRFQVGDSVECSLGDHGWVTGIGESIFA